ncbi:hypothetical protein IH785_12655 [candidate division KSB1 bacterium]|nr:hypothetical protein [candidate division KSB1 bacterium]
MEITEEKIRQISDEAWQQLGSNANPPMLKKVVQEVVKRLMDESKNTPLDPPSRGTPPLVPPQGGIEGGVWGKRA